MVNTSHIMAYLYAYAWNGIAVVWHLARQFRDQGLGTGTSTSRKPGLGRGISITLCPQSRGLYHTRYRWHSLELTPGGCNLPLEIQYGAAETGSSGLTTNTTYVNDMQLR